MTNTEKPTGKAEMKKQGIVETPKKQKITAGADKTQVINKQIAKDDVKKVEEKKEIKEEKIEKTKEEKKKPIQKKPVVKKDEAFVNGKSVPISTKTAVAICRFILKKNVGDAIRDLEQVKLMKRAVPMRGEIPHKKGKGMMSGRYPQKATESFIVLLKSLAGNTIANGIDDPIIVEAMANKASSPYGRFGKWQRKRTHVRIRAREKKTIKKKTKKGGKK